MTTTREYNSPKGNRIIGTLETVRATARISGIDPKTQQPEYEGGSDIHWDTQETLQRDGKVLFICEDGQEWTFDQLVALDLIQTPEN